MTTQVATSRRGLEERVRRFVAKERARDAALTGLLDRLSQLSNAYLFGGVLRDIALFGGKQFERSDIDIVHEPYRAVELDDMLEGLVYARNKFGGLRIGTDRWQVDLWQVKDTWAFRNGYVEYRGVESLLGTTITNWESILYRLDGGKVICSDAYLADIESGYLDIVLDQNPNPLGMCVRVLRLCSLHRELKLSDGATRFLRHAMTNFSSEDICSYEASHYGKAQLSGTRTYWLEKVLDAEIGSGGSLERGKLGTNVA